MPSRVRLVLFVVLGASLIVLGGCSGPVSPAPSDPARGGSFKPSPPGKYEYKTPK